MFFSVAIIVPALPQNCRERRGWLSCCVRPVFQCSMHRVCPVVRESVNAPSPRGWGVSYARGYSLCSQKEVFLEGLVFWGSASLAASRPRQHANKSSLAATPVVPLSWQNLGTVCFRFSQHINLLEAHAVLNYVRWFIRRGVAMYIHIYKSMNNSRDNLMIR